MTFAEAPFAARLATMGDPSESAFDLIYPNHHKLGLNRPPLSVSRLPQMIRYLPDRMMQDRFVECMGIGRDAMLKLKIEKAQSLVVWDEIWQCDLFVYDSNRERYWLANIRDWIKACAAHGDTDHFPDNEKLYWRLPAKLFPTKPTKMPTDAEAA